MPHSTQNPGAMAMLRFLNNTAGAAVLLADGRPIIGPVRAGSVSPWHQIEAAAVTFTIDAVGDGPVVTQRVEGGARYTLTARAALHSESTIRITREAEPAPAIAEQQ